MWEASSVNHFSNSKLVEMKTIEALFDNDTIDMVYVHFVDEDMDQVFLTATSQWK